MDHLLCKARVTNLERDCSNSFPVRSRDSFGPALLIYFHIAACCLSLVYAGQFYGPLQIAPFDEPRLHEAALIIAPFALVSVLFTFSPFSFGYFLSFYFYCMILGYLWLVPFSKFHYDHALAAVSSFVSALAFLIPALLITSPIEQRFVLSKRMLDHLLSFILISTALVLAIGAFYNFRLVGVADIYSFRNALAFPVWLNYAIGVSSNALLPFAFACFVVEGNRWRAASVLLLLLLFYPITLTKLALLAPFWLLFLALLSNLFEARTSVVLSLFLPTLAGSILVLLLKSGALSYEQVMQYFGIVNFRMLALPSSALDFYNDFFSTHSATDFCQISVLKSFLYCPYADPLAIVMQKTYQIGSFNASLFATEGIASVGLIWAPFSVLGCALVISLGNRVSSSLPPKFIMLSGGVLPQVFLNVPFTISMLTSGASILFLLWYLTPRTIFEREKSDQFIDLPAHHHEAPVANPGGSS